MTTPDELLRLAERVEQGSGEDRDLDRDVVFCLYPDIGAYQPHCVGDEPIFWSAPYYKRPCPDLTTSLDAVEALRERLLPSSSVNMSGYEAFSAGVILRPLDRNSPIFDGNAGSEPRARLAALLRAVAGKEA